MKVLKIIFVIVLLLFSSLNSSTSELQNVNNNITADGSFASTVTINPVDNNSNGLYDELNVDVNSNVVSTSYYEFSVALYDNITKAWLLEEYNYYYPTFSGIMNFIVSIDGFRLFELNMAGSVEVRLNVNEYDNNGTYIGSFVQLTTYYYINSINYEKPPVVITVDSIKFLDIETGLNVTGAIGTADFVEIQYTVELTKYGNFMIYSNIDVYMNGSYIEYLNYEIPFEMIGVASGNYTGSVRYAAYGLQDYNSLLTFNMYTYGNYDLNATAYYYSSPNFKTFDAFSGIFEKDPFVLNSISINFLDTDTGSYVNSPIYTADFIEITYDISVNKPGSFTLYSTVNVIQAGSYMEYLNSFDSFEMTVGLAGNYTGSSLIFAAGLQSYFGFIDLSVTSQGSYFNNITTTYIPTLYKTFYNISSEFFEGNYYSLTYNNLNTLDLDGNGLVDHYNLGLTFTVYRDIYFGFSAAISAYNIYNNTESVSAYENDQHYSAGTYYFNISISTSQLINEYTSQISLDLNEYLYLNNDTNFVKYNYQTYYFYIGPYQYDNSEVSIRPNNIYVAPVNVPNSQMKDFLIFNATIEVREYGNLDVYLDITTDTNNFVASYYINMMNISPGVYNIGFIVGGDVLHNSFSTGNFTFSLDANLYTDTGYYYDTLLFGYYIDYMDWNQNYPNPPNINDPPSDDPTTDDPTTNDPITNGTTANNNSTDSKEDVPTLDLPAPSVYISLLSLFSVIVLLRKKRI